MVKAGADTMRTITREYPGLNRVKPGGRPRYGYSHLSIIQGGTANFAPVRNTDRVLYFPSSKAAEYKCKVVQRYGALARYPDTGQGLFIFR